MFCIFISKQRSQTSTASPGQGFHLTDKWSNKKGGQLDQVNLYSCPICSLYCSQLFCPDPDNGVHPCSHLPNHRLASFVFGRWKLLHIPDIRLLRCHALSSLPLCLPHETESFVRKLFRIELLAFPENHPVVSRSSSWKRRPQWNAGFHQTTSLSIAALCLSVDDDNWQEDFSWKLNKSQLLYSKCHLVLFASFIRS